ncbi:2f2e1980-9019-4bcb-9c2e-ee9b1e849886 [Sclerotinia trifoliorum]|uniref:2f2e1980-9019-4bcb-9c2e-ee9b1e849886 n=1 Tax=Sclerotinia trifoliorum TaxID=28548 RepID=A0A8H2VYF9_9HELO|nr:2f2e1980-9019-4bcb-9c2e-ee9b1e849886 [Sclerotinia trifoliorum]
MTSRFKSKQFEYVQYTAMNNEPEIESAYAGQAAKLSHVKPEDDDTGSGTAKRADYVTPRDTVVVMEDGGRLPGPPLQEAERLNGLRRQARGVGGNMNSEAEGTGELMDEENRLAAGEEVRNSHEDRGDDGQISGQGSLRRAMPPSKTHPLFPPLPLYGPSSITRSLQCWTFRTTSFFLSCAFLGLIVMGAGVMSVPAICRYIWYKATFRDPDRGRVFYDEEKERERRRKEDEMRWKRLNRRKFSHEKMDDNEDEAGQGEFVPTEGGKDPLVCDVGYYARRVGLDVEEVKVQTEDGFIIVLWHVYNPNEYTPMTAEQRAARGPELFTGQGPSRPLPSASNHERKYPVLMIHGLLQSSGAYCTNDDHSLAFYLCKQGYDIWLGNNRCGFTPEHTLLEYSDPRMWAWNIRQMGVLDLPALTSRVLSETSFPKLALIAHSQGTTQTLVALAKEQRPELGEKLSVFCALAPAAYAGPLIGKAYFKFMRMISPSFFRLIFGIHAFIPYMMTMHKIVPGKLFGTLGYHVFHFLFNWSDARWDKGTRDRSFQFAPVYVSAESMRWWLGRECFAKQKCILATKEEGLQEEEEDRWVSGETLNNSGSNNEKGKEKLKAKGKEVMGASRLVETEMQSGAEITEKKRRRGLKGSTAWYNEQVPPFALWVAGTDELVDGRKLLRRFERGREPCVKVVHQKVIEEYEHLDVIWAVDVIEQVGRELKEVIWKTCSETDRSKCRAPLGCEEVEVWDGGESFAVSERIDSPESSQSQTDSDQIIWT